MKADEERLARQWESNAEVFASLIGGQGTPHHKQILNPCVERLLGDVRGKRLLDAGCGEGYLSRYYARIGAIVTGVDFSDKLVKICRRQADEESINVEYRHGDISSLDFIPDSQYDLILCNLVLLNVAKLDTALKELNRVLKREGALVFSIVHPAFDLYGPGQWEMGDKDPETGRRQGLYFKVDNYFEECEYQERWKTREGVDFPQPISFFHRTISTYAHALSSAGFVLETLEEPVPSVDDRYFEKERRIPFFLVFKARKSRTRST